MSHIPCYLENDPEPVGYLRYNFPHVGREICIPQMTELQDPWHSGAAVPSKIEEIRLPVERRVVTIDDLELMRARPAHMVDILRTSNVPAGITQVNIDRDLMRCETRLSWAGIKLDIALYETIFDLDQFVVPEDQSALIDHDLLSKLMAALSREQNGGFMPGVKVLRPESAVRIVAAPAAPEPITWKKSLQEVSSRMGVKARHLAKELGA